MFRDTLRRSRIPVLCFVFFSLAIYLIQSSSYAVSVNLPKFSRPTQLNSVCDAYSSLYDDAIATQEYFRLRGGITYEDYERSKFLCEQEGECMQFKIYEGNLFIGNVSENDHCFQTRGESMFLNLYNAVEQARTEGEMLPDIDVFIRCSDLDTGQPATWYLSKSRQSATADPLIADGPKNFFLIADFNFFTWPESYSEPWTLAHQRISRAGQSMKFKDKKKRMVWRGSTVVGPVLLDRVELLRTVEGHEDVADIAEIHWGNGSKPVNYVSPTERCSWRYLVYTEGISHSGRFKSLMLCSSVILGPHIEWFEFWSHLVVPGLNYVEVKRDWSDLLEVHSELEANPKRGAQIARETRKIADLISPRGVSCYMRELIRRYADVCQWEVQAPEVGHGHRTLLGQEWASAEDYIVMKIRNIRT